jgi:iron-sulfur cluster assembly protein
VATQHDLYRQDLYQTRRGGGRPCPKLLYIIMITLTKEAANHFSSVFKISGKNRIRVSLNKAGCSGFTYLITAEDYYLEWYIDDVAFESEGISIVCNEKDLPYLDGMEIDFITDGLNSKITFNNPNEVSSCGCGESVRFGK